MNSRVAEITRCETAAGCPGRCMPLVLLLAALFVVATSVWIVVDGRSGGATVAIESLPLDDRSPDAPSPSAGPAEALVESSPEPAPNTTAPHEPPGPGFETEAGGP
jgi:hypothetical protein